MMKKIFFILLIFSSCSVTNAKRVATGGGHNLVVKADGSLWAWGRNDYGQLGNGEKGNGEFGDYHFTPVKIMDDVVQIAAGYSHTLAVKTDGSLWAWGYNSNGQIGNGKADFLAYASPVKIMDEVVQVAASARSSFAIKTDGSLWAWGENYYAQIGDGTEENKPSPIKIMDGVTQVTAGYSHTLAIKTDGSLWAWGDNSSGELGNGESSSGKKQSTPIKIMDDVAQVAAGSSHTLAIKTDGSLWAWGSNSYGELGDGTTSPKTTPTKILDNISQVSAGSNHSIAISSDNILYSWGINDYLGILVDGTSNATLLPISIYNEVLEVDASRNNTIFLTSDGSVFAFGDNSNGQLGYENSDFNVPVKIPIDDVITIAAGGNTSFAITSLNRLYGWGADNKCEIGDEDCKSKTRPVMVDGLFTQIAIGSGQNSVALKNDKTLWEWGVNCSDHKERRTVPTQTQTDYIQISAGYRRIFGIKEDNSLWAWGNNNYGALGTGNTDDQKEPIKIMEDVAQVNAGYLHTLALKTDGSLWAWGYNAYGQLGDGTKDNKYSPVKIMESVTQVAAGLFHTLVLKSDGSLWAWGQNLYSQLGDGTEIDKITPVKIIDGRVAQIAAGDTHSLAIMTDGSLYAWGENDYGQLGNGKAGNSYEQNYPIKITDDVTKIAAGSEHTLAVKTDGSLWTWGKNSHGQLGQGIKNYSEVPIYVMNIGITQDVITEYKADYVTYQLRSDKTALVKAINAWAYKVVIPDKIEYENVEYYVTAIGDSIFQKFLGRVDVNTAVFPSTIKSVSQKAFWGGVPLSIIWNSNTKIPASSFDSSLYDKVNFLLYVNNANIAPSEVKNLVVNGTADEIVLKDGNDFECPQDFTAKKISYTHNYSMETGYNECAGWETIALPFDVDSITHSSKGELTPMTMAALNSDKKPFWLYELSNRGFVAASRLSANTPYLISMPNNPHYSSYYNLSGSVTFSSTNATVKETISGVSGYNGALFWANYSLRSLSENEYAINVNNDLTTYTGSEKPGSIFIRNFRKIKPFECYLSKNSSNTRSIDIVFADGEGTTGIIDISQKDGREDKQVRVYNLSGQLVDVINGDKSSNSTKELPAGVYIVNGKKVIVQPGKDIIFP
jgi:alpha-tubulin suppressor-like RCC1 family protein